MRMKCVFENWLVVLLVSGVIVTSPTASQARDGAQLDLRSSTAVGRGHVQVAQAKKKSEPTKGGETPPAAVGQQVEPEAWVINCSNQGAQKLTCEMTQNIIDQRSRSQIMLIALKGASPTSAGALLFRVFHGIYLPGGVAVTVDKGQAAQLPFQKSDQTGVYAALPLDDRVLGELKRGSDLKVSVQINQGEALEIVARLKGFGPSYDKVKSLN